MMQDQTFCKNVKQQSLLKKRFIKGVKSGLKVEPNLQLDEICRFLMYVSFGRDKGWTEIMRFEEAHFNRPSDGFIWAGSSGE